MRQIVADGSSQPFVNIAYSPKWDVDLVTIQSGGMDVLGTSQGARTITYVTDDRAYPAGRTRREVLTSDGNWGRRWTYNYPVAPGQVARYRYWVKTSAAVSIDTTFEWGDLNNVNYAGGTSGGRINLQANVWTAIEQTATIPATGAGRNVATLRSVGWTSPAQATTGFEFKLGPLMVTLDQPLPESHVDGDSPGWRWTGTTGGSLSVGYPLAAQGLVRNVMTNPDLGGTDTSQWTAVSGEGTTTSNVLRQAETESRNGWVHQTTMLPAWPGGETNFYVGPTQPAAPGDRWTFLARVRYKTGTPKGLHVRLVPRNAAGSGIGDIVGSTVTPSRTGEWVWISATGTMPAATVRVQFQCTRTSPVVGDVIQTDCVMAFRSENLGSYAIYADGDVPGWSWRGTAHAAESIGPAYTLESIAGAPVAERSTAGSTTLDGLTTLDGMTLYVAGTRLLDQAAWTDHSGVNANGAGFTGSTGFGIQMSGSTPNVWQYRLDTIASGAGFNQSASGATSQGAHVYAVTINTGITVRENWHDGTKQNTVPATPNSGVQRSALVQSATSTSFAPARVLLFTEKHSDDTLKKITAWLARRHGSPVPAGY